MENTRRNLLKAATASVLPVAMHDAGKAAGPMRMPNSDPAGARSILDFIDPMLHSAILDGTSKRDVSAAVQSGIDTGANLYFPGNGNSRYVIDGRIKLSTNYQRLFSDGWVRLDLCGTDPQSNAIELLSTRRDSGDKEATREAQSLSGFRLTGPPSARYASLIFLEEGIFYPYLDRLFSAAGTGRGYFGKISDAFIRINGSSRSYVNDVTIRDCVFSGIMDQQTEDFPPCGIWVEGSIEGRIENTKVFYFDECMRLGDGEGRTRNVQFMLFDQVQLEPTKPNQAKDRQASLNIYTAYACTFRDCRLDPGNGRGSENSVAVRISKGGRGASQIRFRDCSFQGMRHARHVFEIEPGATTDQVVLAGGDIRGFSAALIQDLSGKADVKMSGDVFYDKT